MTFREAVEYEISGSWWAGYLPFQWMHNLAGRYFVWKTHRKFGRLIRRAAYQRAMEEKAAIEKARAKKS